MNILICNVGSTSLKYQLFDMEIFEAGNNISVEIIDEIREDE